MHTKKVLLCGQVSILFSTHKSCGVTDKAAASMMPWDGSEHMLAEFGSEFGEPETQKYIIGITFKLPFILKV